MSLLRAEGLSLSYGKKVLLREATLAVGPRDRIGLVGANGTGKSSLLKILAGRMSPDAGTVRLRRGVRAGYLPQDVAELPEGSLLEVVLASVPGRAELEAQLAAVERSLQGSVEPQAQLELSQNLADLHDELEHFEERHGRHHAERILVGLGFKASDFARDTRSLSGGWRMRAALASLLLLDPELLLLDEPTNHLDLPTLTWFDEFLRRSNRAVVLISHDRDFLNRQIDRVVALEVEGLRTYAGNYDQYRRLREDELEQLRARAARQAARRAEVEAFVERFGAKATKARQAQSRLKMLEKEEVIEVQEERPQVSFSFPEVARSGREVVSLRDIDHAFGEHRLYEGLNATILRGQRVAVVGVNGAGKTTLLKLVAGELAPSAGTAELGHNVVLGYYAQHHADTLDPRATVLEEVQKLVPDKPQSYVRGVLGAFLFSGDDVDKKIGVLSGGERARVALAKLLLVPANFLVLDEPTNHLDLQSSEALIAALKGFDGTLLFVSHNRSFLNQLATDIWDVRDRKVEPFPGNLDDYHHHLRQLALAESGDESPAPVREARSDRERRRLEAEARQRRSATEGPIRKAIAALEAAIAELERAQGEREKVLAEPGLYDQYEKARPVLEAHRAGKAELESLYARWEEAQHRLERVSQGREGERRG